MISPFSEFHNNPQPKVSPFADFYGQQGGAEVSSDPLEKKEEPKKERTTGEWIRGLGKQFIDGMLMGALPKAGFVDAAYVAALSGDKNPMQTALGGVKNIEEDLASFQKDNPISSFGAQMAGGILSPMGQAVGGTAVSLVPKAFMPAGKIAQGAVRGAAGGSVGAGAEAAIRAPEGEMFQRMAAGVVIGAGAGALLGAGAAKVFGKKSVDAVPEEVAQKIGNELETLRPKLPWHDGPTSDISAKAKLPWADAAKEVSNVIKKELPNIQPEQAARLGKAISHPSGPLDTSKLAPETIDLANRLDFDNVAARVAKESKRLEDPAMTGLQRNTRFLVQDFLVPISNVDDVAGQAAHRMNHVGQMMHQPIEQGIFVGGKKIAPALREVASPANGDTQALKLANVYRQAKQAITHNALHAADDKVPAGIMSDEAANTVIKNLEAEFPVVMQINEQANQFWSGLITKMSDLGIINKSQEKMFRQNPDYVSLSRSVFGKQGMGFLRGRDNPESEKLIGDMWHQMHDAARLVVYKGEQNRVLRTLAERSLQNENLAPHVKILPGDDVVVNELIKDLPSELPETVRRAIAELSDVGPPRDGRFHYRGSDGKNYKMELSNEFKASIDELLGARPFDSSADVGRHWFEPASWLPKTGKALKETEGVAAHLYSVYRDIAKGGVAFDALEASYNQGQMERFMNQKIGFNPITDPIRGFFALLKGDARIAEIASEGGTLSGRFASPTAELEAKSVQELLKKAGYSNAKLRLTNPAAFFREFSGNLANATRTGASLKSLKNGASLEQAAYVFNNILGDPTTRGKVTAGIMQYIRFFNYPIQANTRALQAAGIVAEGTLDKMSGSERVARLAITAGRASITLAPAAVGSWMLRKAMNNEAANEAAKGEAGKRFMFLPNPFSEDGDVYMIRKPYAFGAMIMNPIDQYLNYVDGKGGTEAAMAVASGLLDEMIPNLVPIQATGLLENAFGSRFDPLGRGGGSLITSGRSRLLPEDQAEASASNLSRLIASKTNISAGKVENTLRTFAIGGSYQDLLKFDRFIFGDNQKPELPDRSSKLAFPFGIQKQEQAAAMNHHVREFYSEYDRYSRIANSITAADKEGNDAKLNELERTYANDWHLIDLLTDYKADMDEVNREMNDTKYRYDMGPQEKRRELDRLLWERGLVAREAMKLFKQMKQ